MARHNVLGRLGEDRAAVFLAESGCTILERNWRAGRAEVDFIVLDGEEIVVVEVKTRARPVERPAELLSPGKCRNLLAAGEAYLATRGIRREIRFDLIVVCGRGEMRVERFRDAIKLF
ncbi:MAG: YraN family protein [Odoribacteraceae bacterium]|nr:YraN family protein [Odoribacteraceae bacterium]